MAWTVVIAGQAVGAQPSVLPCRQSLLNDNVVRRAHLLAFAAMNAEVGINCEFPVTYHVGIEKGTNNVTEGPWCGSTGGVALALLPLVNHFSIHFQLLRGMLCLFAFALLTVGVHEWQADIRFGHDEREDAVRLQTMMFVQLVFKYLHGAPNAVATGHQDIDKGVGQSLDNGLANKLAHYMRRLPSVHREAKAKAFAFRQFILTSVFLHLVGNEDHTF